MKAIIDARLREVARIKARIGDLTDDPIAIRDTLEGETDLAGIARNLVIAVAEAEAREAALAGLLSLYSARRAWIKDQINGLRALLGETMELGEWKRLKLDVATVSLRAGPPQVRITDERLIPEEFWRTPPPEINRIALREALKNRVLPGAILSNGGMTVSIRTV